MRALSLNLLAATTLVLAALAVPARADAPTFPQGLDISHHNHDAGPFSWPQIMTSGPTFAISKATEGSTFLDNQFANDWPVEQANELARGAYHFAQPGLPMTTAVTQADFYAST